MKWILLVLAFVSLLICCLAGPVGDGIRLHTGTLEFVRLAALADTVTCSIGIAGIGLIGVAAVISAALIQISENRRKQ